MKSKLYHNPKCSKSRATLALLEERKVPLEIIPYLEAPLDFQELKNVLDLLNKKPQDILRFKDSLARELNLTPRDHRTHEEWLNLLVEHPALLERPIFTHAGKATIGRPPENVLSLL